jgi:hypothetical protein
MGPRSGSCSSQAKSRKCYCPLLPIGRAKSSRDGEERRGVASRRRALDELGEAALTGLLPLGAHHPVRRCPAVDRADPGPLLRAGLLELGDLGDVDVLQLLPSLRGVKRCMCRSSSMRRITPSIQPKQSAWSTALRPGHGLPARRLLEVADEDLGRRRVIGLEPLAKGAGAFEEDRVGLVQLQTGITESREPPGSAGCGKPSCCRPHRWRSARAGSARA